jgi:1-acyl-sn-glycerol-3-phosphate acyltransferase
VRAADKRGRPLEGNDAPNWTIARIARATLGRLLLVLFRVEVVSADRVPSGGAILAGNHVSYLDPVLLWCGAPRPVHFMAKVELWSSSFIGWALDQFWAFPVDRAGADRASISTATALLEHGDLVGMFPEGTRRRDDSDARAEAHGGVAFIAIRAGVPVVPVGIVGTEKAWPPGRRLPRLVHVTVRYGEPVYPDRFEGSRKERVSAMTAEIMERVDGLVRQGGES